MISIGKPVRCKKLESKDLRHQLREVRKQLDAADAVFTEMLADGEQPTRFCRLERQKLERRLQLLMLRIWVHERSDRYSDV